MEGVESFWSIRLIEIWQRLPGIMSYLAIQECYLDCLEPLVRSNASWMWYLPDKWAVAHVYLPSIIIFSETANENISSASTVL